MADYSLVQSPEQPNKFFSPDYGWLTPAQPNPPDKKRAVPITRAPAFVDALSPGGAFYRHNPDRATRELEELQQREMTRVSQIETMSPGMGVGYWNESPALKKMGLLSMKDENGVNVYSLNGQPVAYGMRGADKGYRITESRPGQKPAGGPEAGRPADPDRIERSTGRSRLWFKKPDPWWKRAERTIDAVFDVPNTLIEQTIGFPASKVGGAAAAMEAARQYPEQWLASKVLPSRIAPPENPLQTGQKVEKGIYDFIAQPDRPRADLTTNAVKAIGEFPPLHLASLPFEKARGLRNTLTEKGHPDLGYAAETAIDIPLLWLLGRGGKEAGLPERLVPEEPYPIGLSIRDVGEGEGKAPGPGKLAEVREPAPRGKLGGSAAEIVVGSNVAELNGLRFGDAVGRLYDSALSPRDNSLKRISVGKVSAENAGRVKEAGAKAGVAIDVSGYTRTIDNYSIRHIHGEHGDPIAEAKRGQIAVTKEDIARIPEIVETADVVSYAEKTELGRDGILYQKRIDGTVYYVEEVRTGKGGTLAPATLYKRKAGTS